jgi:hypothetical protein
LEHFLATDVADSPRFNFGAAQDDHDLEAEAIADLRLRKWWRFCTADTYSFQSLRILASRRFFAAAPPAAPPYDASPIAPYSVIARPPFVPEPELKLDSSSEPEAMIKKVN